MQPNSPLIQESFLGHQLFNLLHEIWLGETKVPAMQGWPLSGLRILFFACTAATFSAFRIQPRNDLNYGRRFISHPEINQVTLRVHVHASVPSLACTSVIVTGANGVIGEAIVR